MSPIYFEPADAKRVSVKYVVIVALLLVVIIATLAQLWLIERQRRMAAEEKLTDLYLKYELGQTAVSPPATTAPADAAAGP